MEREEREMGREGRGKGEGREMRKERRGRRGGGEMRRRGIIVGGIALLLVLGCNNGVAELEKKNSFYESVVKIGQGFQGIFGIFGKTMGDDFGIVKSDDNRSKIGDHFNNVKKGLEGTKTKLEELSGEISSAKNADTTAVEVVIKNVSEVLTKLIGSVTKLAGSAGNTAIGEHGGSSGAVAAKKEDVEAVIKGVIDIIGVAKESDIKLEQLEKGNAGVKVGNTDGPKLLVHNGDASSEASKLAAEVAKADPWAMIDKIKNAKTVGGNPVDSSGAEAGALALGGSTNNASGTAKTNADLAAAVALKAMTKEGKFSSTSANVDISGAAASAVNKVLGVLDEIIRRTVEKNLEKVREAVNKIKYSDTNGEATEAKK